MRLICMAVWLFLIAFVPSVHAIPMSFGLQVWADKMQRNVYGWSLVLNLRKLVELGVGVGTNNEKGYYPVLGALYYLNTRGKDPEDPRAPQTFVRFDAKFLMLSHVWDINAAPVNSDFWIQPVTQFSFGSVNASALGGEAQCHQRVGQYTLLGLNFGYRWALPIFGRDVLFDLGAGASTGWQARFQSATLDTGTTYDRGTRYNCETKDAGLKTVLSTTGALTFHFNN